MAFLLLIVIVWALIAYEKHPIKSFCSDLPRSATQEEVAALAERRGFGPVVRDADEVLVVGQGGPFWRYACDVKFRNNRQVSKEVIDGD
jgi:hypothetical protein